jgi:hypothetical protein
MLRQHGSRPISFQARAFALIRRQNHSHSLSAPLHVAERLAADCKLQYPKTQFETSLSRAVNDDTSTRRRRFSIFALRVREMKMMMMTR